MFQGSMGYEQVEQRRRRRFAFPSRASLAAWVGAAEGASAAMILILCSTGNSMLTGVNAPTAQIVVNILAGCIFGLISLRQTGDALFNASRRQYPVSQALLAFTASIVIANLAALGFDIVSFQSKSDLAQLAIAALAVVGVRVIARRQLSSLMEGGRLQVERLALLGTPDDIGRFERETPSWRSGAQVVAKFSVLSLPVADYGKAIPEFVQSCLRKRCGSLLILGEMQQLAIAGHVSEACDHYALNVLFAPMPVSSAHGQRLIDVLAFGPNNSVRLTRPPLDYWDRIMKRGLDISLAGLALLFLAPLLIFVAGLVRLTSRGPALFRQERRGYNGETFHILKFRTMSVTEDGRSMKPAVSGDLRITALGRFLRRSSIDELPQLINVLRGEMSLVGPRPHGISHDAELSRRFSLYARRQRITPGITGWAQVNGFRGDVSTQERLEGRTLHDLYYAENWSIGFDLWIIFLTIFSPKTRNFAE
jgi:exopolysaccharide biosynthesis polyprenyl glycosylphosphotransferase